MPECNLRCLEIEGMTNCCTEFGCAKHKGFFDDGELLKLCDGDMGEENRIWKTFDPVDGFLTVDGCSLKKKSKKCENWICSWRSKI